MAQVDTSGVRNKLAARAQQPGSDAKPVPAKDPVRALIESMRPAIEQAVPRHVDPGRLTRILLTTVRSNPKLVQAAMESEESRRSLLASIALIAQLGLEPGPLGQVHIVPFASKRGHIEGQVIIDYKGYLELARRSGYIESVTVEPVCENDEFEFELGLNPRLRHKPAIKARGKPYGYYGVVRFRGGGYQVCFLTLEEIEQYRKRSKSPDEGPWVTDYDAMCRKTVIRRMWRWLPMSVEMAAAAVADEGTARDVPARGMVNVTPAYSVDGSEEVAALHVEPAEPAAASQDSPPSQEALLP